MISPPIIERFRKYLLKNGRALDYAEAENILRGLVGYVDKLGAIAHQDEQIRAKLSHNE